MKINNKSIEIIIDVVGSVSFEAATYIRSLIDETGRYRPEIGYTDVTVYHSVGSIFLWSDTPQGRDFWSRINLKTHRKIGRLLTEKGSYR